MTFYGKHQAGGASALMHDMGGDQHYCAPMSVEEPAARRLAHMIKAAREARKWTQPKLAEAAGVSKPTVQRYESGRSQFPEPAALRKIFKALDLDVLEIPVILGLVTREELGLSAAPPRRFSATTEAVLAELENPDVSDGMKRALVELLRERRKSEAPPTAKPRKQAS